MDHLYVIINPSSGQREPVLNTLNDVFSTASFSWEVDITREAGHAAELTRRAIDREVDAIAVYGGDGSVTEVSDVLAHTDIPLGILPGGTGNAFAAALDIPPDLHRAAEIIATPDRRIAHIDVGTLEDQVFTVAVGTGFLADALGKTPRDQKSRLGLFAYTINMLEKMPNYQTAEYTITLDDDTTIQRHAVACYILNVGTVGLGKVAVVPEADPTDGKLNLVLFEQANLGQVISALATAASLDDLPVALSRWEAESIHIASTPQHPITIDGEIGWHTPCQLDVKPAALSVIVSP